jgi:hypothetical protein
MLSLVTLKITGPDAAAFLQGQLTNDVRRLKREPEILAAWCSPKGRVIWFGTIRPIESGFGLSVPADRAEDIARRLTMFRFRSKVEIEAVDEGETADPASLVETGHPYIGAEQSEQFTPHMLNLDLLDAISFDKGCYTGQEVVARMQYLGKLKRRMYLAHLTSDTPPRPGDDLFSQASTSGQGTGKVVDARPANSGYDLLAVIETASAEGEAVCLGAQGPRLQLQKLPYPFPE